MHYILLWYNRILLLFPRKVDLQSFIMDVKGITWVGNVYQKFEAMCLEVEEVMYQVCPSLLFGLSLSSSRPFGSKFIGNKIVRKPELACNLCHSSSPVLLQVLTTSCFHVIAFYYYSYHRLVVSEPYLCCYVRLTLDHDRIWNNGWWACQSVPDLFYLC